MNISYFISSVIKWEILSLNSFTSSVLPIIILLNFFSFLLLDKTKSTVNGFVFYSFPFNNVLGLDTGPSKDPSVIFLSVVVMSQTILFFLKSSSIKISSWNKVLTLFKDLIFLLTDPLILFSSFPFLWKSKSSSMSVPL